MSNTHESANMPVPDPVEVVLNAEEYLEPDELQNIRHEQQLKSLENQFPQEVSEVMETKIQLIHDLRGRTEMIENTTRCFAEDTSPAHKKIYLHGLRAAESNAKTAYGCYVDALFAMPDQTSDELCDAIVEAIGWVAYSQRQINESRKVTNQMDLDYMRAYIADEVLPLCETYAARDMVKSIYDIYFLAHGKAYISQLEQAV